MSEANHTEIERAYEMGKDCAINGADTINCHFSLFATKELTEAWERGKKEAEKCHADKS